MKNGWTPKTTYSKLKADFEDDIDHDTYDLEILEYFCFAEYEEQRELIFYYLFASQEEAKKFFYDKIRIINGTTTN